MEFDIATLIHEIKIRKPLWQRCNRSCREVVNDLWNEVASKMGVSKELVKTKWKGLRDNFRSELRKIPKKKDYMHQSKWIYFNDMMFIEDQMISRSIENPTIISGDAENVNVEVDVYTGSDNEPGTFDNEKKNKTAEYQCDFTSILCNALTADKADLSVRRNCSSTYYDDKMTSSQQCLAGVKAFKRHHQDLNSLEEDRFGDDSTPEAIPTKRTKYNVNSDADLHLENDDDFYFLMSFLPTMKSLPPDKKMFLRFKIQRLVYNEVYNNSK